VILDSAKVHIIVDFFDMRIWFFTTFGTAWSRLMRVFRD